MKLKQSILAASVAAGLGIASSAFALPFTAAPTLFDRDGGGAATGAIDITNMAWVPNTVLTKGLWNTTRIVVGGVPSLIQSPTTGFDLFSQGTLGTFSAPGTVGPFCSSPGICQAVTGTEFTFQLQAGMLNNGTTDTGRDTVDGIINAASTTVPLFKIWYDATPDSGTPAAILAGTGFGDNMAVTTCDKAANEGAVGDGSKLIYCGTIVDATNSFTQAGSGGVPAQPPFVPLDASGVDNYGAFGTETGLGSYNVDVETVYQDFAFFKEALKSLTVDVNHNGAANLPFAQVDPSALVVGNSWDLGSDTGAMTAGPARIINDLNCRNAAAPTPGNPDSRTCDMIYQGQPTTSFGVTVPEPGTLAVLGLGLGILGFAGRTRRRG